jgi:hypothetical protein
MVGDAAIGNNLGAGWRFCYRELPKVTADCFGWEPVVFVGIHGPILSISTSLLGNTISWTIIERHDYE